MFVLIAGNKGTTDKTAAEYTRHIIYGDPAIEAVDLVAGRFIALCEYEDMDTLADHTFRRMPSFNLGASMIPQRDVAVREFGANALLFADRLYPSDNDAA